MALVASHTAALVKDPFETDQSDRLLRYHYLFDGTFINAELVGTEHAHVASDISDPSEIDSLSPLEAETKSTSLGLWGLPTGTPIPLPTNILL